MNTYCNGRPRRVPRLPLDPEPPEFPPILRGVPQTFPVIMWPAPHGVPAFWVEEGVFVIDMGTEKLIQQVEGIRPSLSLSYPGYGWFAAVRQTTEQIKWQLQFNRPSRDLYWYIYEYAMEGDADTRIYHAQQEPVDHYNKSSVAECYTAGKMSTFHQWLTTWLQRGNLGCYWQENARSFEEPRYLAGLEERNSLLPPEPTG